MTTNPLSVQLYSLREELGRDRRGTLRALAAAGYRAVEPYDLLTEPDALRADLEAAGLRVSSAHAPASGERRAEVFAAAKAVGAGTVIVPSLPAARFADADGVRGVAAELNRAAAEGADHGLRLGYHNHDLELAQLINGRPALEALADLLDPPVLLEVDTYWAAVGGQDVPALLGRLGDRVRYLHVKDGPITKDDPMVAVGSGRMPVPDILAAQPAVEWHVVELDRCATDMMTALAASHAYLTELAAGGAR